FPDPNKQDDTRGGGIRFGGGFGFGGGGGLGGRGAATASTAVSERSKKQGRVISVPDPRTSSIIVSAAKELMPQIAEMVAQLDNDASRKKHVENFALQAADPDEVKTLLNELFASSNSRNSANSQNNALTSRQQQNAQNANRTSSSSGLGSSSRGLGQ
ncbi:MAG: putative type secretion system protein, partial [Verrucomicrobiales bacterium]|nr:putative type secretion system protein [Verrucomicrobiales bacterium]